jgi:hypothetical protein
MALSTAKLWIKVTAIVGSPTIYLTIDKTTDNWGTVLEANEADFISTGTTAEGSNAISGTGWQSFTIDVDDISAENIWFRLRGNAEGGHVTNTITFASQNNATAGDRPYLELVASSGGVKLLTLMGCGV